MQDLVILIPARGNSKRIPQKNMALLKGKPLLQYAIEAALAVTNQVYVSTENTRIFEFTKKCGAIPICRPMHLASDEATQEEVIFNFSEKVAFNHILLLECTSPLITAEDLRAMLYNYDGDIPTILLAKHLLFRVDITPDRLYARVPPRKQSQEFEFQNYTYTEAGAWLFSKDHLLTHQQRTAAYNNFIIMEGPNIDIDTELDLKIAEVIIRSL